MMLRCRDISDLLLDYVDGELPPAVRRQLDEHLTDCPGCLGFLNTYRHTVSVAHDLRCEDIPPELQAKLRSFLKEKLEHPGIFARIRRRLRGSS
jgi:anti-sigma factor RsiW